MTLLSQPSAPQHAASASTIEEILVLHHSHLDVGYTHSQPIIWRLQNEYLTQVIDWLEDTAGLPGPVRPKWTCEVTEPVRRWLLEASPTQRDRFVALAHAGRIGFGGLRWNIAARSDRAALRRLIDGKRQIEDLTGMPIRTAAQHDVNGVPWPIADVMLDAGIELFIMGINTYLGKAVTPRPGAFRWEAPSGRHLTVFNGNHYTMFDQLLNAWDDSVDRMRDGWARYSEHLGDIGYRLPFAYLSSTCSPIMWDNAPPNPFMPDLLQRWNEADAGPAVTYATFDDLLARVRALPQDELVVQRGDWTDYWSFGYGSTPIETAINQASKPLLAAAGRLGGDPLLITAASEQIDLFDEHTWSNWHTAVDQPQARAQETLKAAAAHEGHELASFAVMDALDRFARNPDADRGMSGVLVVNPTDFTREEFVDVPTAWVEEQGVARERTYRASRMLSQNRSWDRRPGTPVTTVGPICVAPRSWQVIALPDLPEPTVSPLIRHGLLDEAVVSHGVNGDDVEHSQQRAGFIESPFHRLSFDAVTGRIHSLVDRSDGRELMSRRPGDDLFAIVRESPDPLVEPTRQAFFLRDLAREQLDQSNWQDWSRVLAGPGRIEGVMIDESPHGITLSRVLTVPGMSPVTQRIRMSGHDPLIQIEVEFDLPNDDSPHGIYLRIPLSLAAGWRAAFDTAGEFVELDDHQLPGANRGWPTLESVAVAWDDDTAIALISPDASSVQFGAPSFGPPPDRIERRDNPALLSWISNNYWDTNYPLTQAGHHSVRYALLTLSTPDHDRIFEHVSAVRNPLLTWPVTRGGRPPSRGLLDDVDTTSGNRRPERNAAP